MASSAWASGAGREKWGYVPESTSDFIFATIGEELGLVGTLCVTALYGGLAFAGLRIARRVPDLFARLAATGITAWIVVQAVVNIGAVIGVLPITEGVPLPLISAGLSSLLMHPGRARHADGVRQARARRPGRFGRTRPRLAATRSKLARSSKAPTITQQQFRDET